MKIYELPEDQKIYIIELSNKRDYVISGLEKKDIMASRSQFIELKTGEIINKSFVVSITLDKEATKDKYLKLPGADKKLLENKITT